MGIDRDRNIILDFDATRDLAPKIPGIQNPFRPDDSDCTGDNGSMVPDGIPDGLNDFDNDGVSNADEFLAGTDPVDNWTAATPPLGLTAASNVPFTSITLTWNSAPQGFTPSAGQRISWFGTCWQPARSLRELPMES